MNRDPGGAEPRESGEQGYLAAMVPLSSVVGGALGGVFRAVGAIRPAAKPLHPQGVIRHARLVRHGVCREGPP